ncbi:hypothetical protein [Zhongshania sp.]|jgi:hypothetical protein|uniref:hypothetical protein n=1 Tax=Zhongshania sp. TaxID=1971902 RepID=UPI002A82BEC3|nr:hypothetical protein [Zhongshania sp.]
MSSQSYIRAGKLSLLLILAIGVLSACTSSQAKPEAAVAEGFKSCETPRPQMCTREYLPVCGHVDTGIRCITTPCPSQRHQTYGNACSACADDKVMGYEQGDCASYGK